jgi:hypothetical protein
MVEERKRQTLRLRLTTESKKVRGARKRKADRLR